MLSSFSSYPIRDSKSKRYAAPGPLLGWGTRSLSPHKIMGAFYDTLDKDIDARLLALSMAILLVIVLSIEHGVKTIEKRLDDHVKYLVMLRKVYSELMIMGIISFGVLLLHDIIAVPLSSVFWVHFELVHVGMFAAAVFYVIHAFVFMRVTEATRSSWVGYEQTSAEELIMLAEKRDSEGASKPMWKRWMCGRGKLSAAMEFHAARNHITSTLLLPSDFWFARYMRGVLADVIIEQMEIKIFSWALALSILCGYMVIEVASGDEGEGIDVQISEIAAPTIGWITLGLDWALLFVARRSRDTLLRSIGCDDSLAHSDSALGKLKAASSGGGSQAKSDKINVHNTKIIKLFRSAASQHIPFWVTNARQAYPCGKPWVLRRALDLIMLSQCFTLTISILINIRSLARDKPAAQAAALIVLDLLPQMIILCFLSPRVLKNIAYLHAMASPSLDVIEQVLGEMEQVETLRNELQCTLRASMRRTLGRNVGENKALLVNSLMTLFDTLDESREGRIGRENFGRILLGFEMHVSHKQLRLLFSAVDMDHDGKIDIYDFLVLVLGKDYKTQTQQSPRPSTLSPREAQLTMCFGGLLTRCLLCHKMVNVVSLAAHISECSGLTRASGAFDLSSTPVEEIETRKPSLLAAAAMTPSSSPRKRSAPRKSFFAKLKRKPSASTLATTAASMSSKAHECRRLWRQSISKSIRNMSTTEPHSRRSSSLARISERSFSFSPVQEDRKTSAVVVVPVNGSSEKIQAYSPNLASPKKSSANKKRFTRRTSTV